MSNCGSQMFTVVNDGTIMVVQFVDGFAMIDMLFYCLKSYFVIVIHVLDGDIDCAHYVLSRSF